MKRRDVVILTLIVVNCSYYCWRVYAASHEPAVRVTTVSVREIIGDTRGIIGDRAAPYVLVEFGDYECPPCARLFPDVESFLTRNRLKVRFQFRQYPLPGHQYALPAALLAEVARQRGCFEGVHKDLYQLRAKIDDAALAGVAALHGIDWSGPVDDPAPADAGGQAKIAEDRAVGNRIPVTGTPSLFLCTPGQQAYKVSSLQQAQALLQ